MSFDIFLHTVPGAPNFDRAIVTRAFEGLTDHLDDDYWNLYLQDGEITSVTVNVTAGPLIDGFSVNRPPSPKEFPEFWQAMFEVLRQTPTFLFWPCEGPHPRYCVANPAFPATLPEELTNALGQPAVARSGAEIDAAITATGH